MASQHIMIRQDLQSCHKISARRPVIHLADSLKTLPSEVPPIEDVPYHQTRAFVTVVRAELVKPQHVVDVTQLNRLATPIASRITQLKQTLVDKFKNYVPIETSLSLTVNVFVANLWLQILVMFLYDRCKFIPDLVSKYVRTRTLQSSAPLKLLLQWLAPMVMKHLAQKDRKFTLVYAAELAKLQTGKLSASADHFLTWNSENLPLPCMPKVQHSRRSISQSLLRGLKEET